jgi:predicted short-subunit dehydrogenase-like oxidoreductase (DUF2520 family)
MKIQPRANRTKKTVWGIDSVFRERVEAKADILARAMAASVAIVGAGRVGRALGRRLRELGWTIGVVTARSQASARSAVRFIGGGTAHARLTSRVTGSDLVLITTPDDTLPIVSESLARIGGAEWHGRIVLHTSGALDHDVLAALADLGASTGSLHPMQTFSARTLPSLEGIVFAVEGERRALRLARSIASSLGGIPINVPRGGKPAYHAAGAFVAGHGLALIEAATQILMCLGFTRRRAVKALLPLMRQMLDNFERLGPRAAWTGPLSRGDYATIEKHIAALRSFPREYANAYMAVSQLAGRVLPLDPDAVLEPLQKIARFQEKNK